jgi:hypothetical protein
MGGLTSTHASTHTLTHSHTHPTHTRIHSHVIHASTQTLIHASTHTLIHSYAHPLTHSYTHTRIHSHTHTLIHASTHTRTPAVQALAWGLSTVQATLFCAWPANMASSVTATSSQPRRAHRQVVCGVCSILAHCTPNSHPLYSILAVCSVQCAVGSAVGSGQWAVGSVQWAVCSV